MIQVSLEILLAQEVINKEDGLKITTAWLPALTAKIKSGRSLVTKVKQVNWHRKEKSSGKECR